MTHIIDPILSRPREGVNVNLRPMVSTDAEVTLRWRHSNRARLLNPGATTITEQAQWIESRPPDEANFIVETKQGCPLGMLSLLAVDRVGNKAETARFLIGDEDGAKGIPAAVEAMKLLYELAFDDLKLQRIYGTIASENVQMIKWQKYLGMKEEGRLRRHYFLNGEFQDAVCMGLLVEEYREITKRRMQVLMTATRSPTN